MADPIVDTYYASDGFIGYGSQLLVGQGDGSPETFLAVYGVQSIKPGKIETPTVNKTHLRSPDRHHEKIATISDSGPFTVNLQWNPKQESQSLAGGANFTAGGLLKLKQTCAETNFKIVLSDGSPATEWPFRGVVTGFEPGEIGLDNLVNATVEITPLQSYMADLP